MAYTCVDAFCGAGGLSLGLIRAGYQIVFSFDADSCCANTHLLNKKYFKHPCACVTVEKVLKDSKGFFSLNKKGLFLLAGGPPCQGFSVQRIGKDQDNRNGLVFNFVDLISKLHPAYVLMENVPGIVGKRGIKIFEEAIDRIGKHGYWFHHKELDAQDYGVPQRRKRIFLIAERKDLGDPSFVFPTSFSRKIIVRDAIGHLPEPPEDGTDHPILVHHRRDRLSDLNKKRLSVLKEGQGREYLPTDLLPNCHKMDAGRIGHRFVYGRMIWDEVAPTITARFDSFTRGKFGHPDQLRTISLREGALLQTFPKDFIFSGNKVDIARQIGNAVPSKLAEVLGRQIILCHKKKRRNDF